MPHRNYSLRIMLSILSTIRTRRMGSWSQGFMPVERRFEDLSSFQTFGPLAQGQWGRTIAGAFFVHR